MSVCMCIKGPGMLNCHSLATLHTWLFLGQGPLRFWCGMVTLRRGVVGARLRRSNLASGLQWAGLSPFSP
eukprot:466270-Pelagomonas_calceolata.AAC.2